MDTRLKISPNLILIVDFVLNCVVLICFCLITIVSGAQARSNVQELDRSKTLDAIYRDLKLRFKGAKEFSIRLSKSDNLIKFQSLKPVLCTIRIPNMVGDLQNPTKSPGPAKKGFTGNVKLIPGDTRLYQAVYPQTFPRFFERGKILYETHAWAPYSEKYDFHIKANFLSPGKTSPVELSKFEKFVQNWDKLAVLKRN